MKLTHTKAKLLKYINDFSITPPNKELKYIAEEEIGVSYQHFHNLLSNFTELGLVEKRLPFKLTPKGEEVLKTYVNSK